MYTGVVIKRVSMAVLMLLSIISCNKDEEEYEYMEGSVNFDFPTYVVVDQVIETYASGITVPSDPIYFWVASGLDLGERDTVYSQSIRVTVPHEPGEYSITAFARHEGYYSKNKVVNVVAITDEGDAVDGWTKTSDTFTDPRDGSVYYVRDYGHLTWFVQNLRYAGDGEDTLGRAYENSDGIGSVFGRLYSWNDATGGEAGSGLGGGPQGACPEGWTVPTMEDWEDFAAAVVEETGLEDVSVDFMDSWRHLGEVMTAAILINGDAMWPYSPDNEHTNDVDWNGIPTGNSNNSYSDFENIAEYGMWWASSELDNGMVPYRYVFYNGSDCGVYYTDKDTYGVSVRCVKVLE